MKLAHVRCLELLKCMAREVEEMNEKEIEDARVRDAVAKAAYNGSVEFVTEIARASPEFVWTRDLATKVFAIAIDRREAEVFNLIYALHDRDALVSFVESRTTILHIAGSQASTEVRNLIPGAAFQMQRELQWFKVYNIFHFSFLIFFLSLPPP
ncbi:hypothetical protein TorRG33x02_162850 [Trema orientale]|uniref:Uncharacterized protein n=1 Tax=Trema orientale TaxID=63057 RepID=A0A2P5EQU8_TREOI|nr:hypothetical protein TorRG33x02_162850 [Trema orientale]